MGEMLFDDFDVDALLDAQSSDDDGNDLPELERSLDDILNDDDDEFADVLGHSVPVKSSSTGAREPNSLDFDPATNEEHPTSKLDGELLDKGLYELESHRYGDNMSGAASGILITSIEADQRNLSIADTSIVANSSNDYPEKEPPPQTSFAQGSPRFVEAEIDFQGKGESQIRSGEDGVESEATGRGGGAGTISGCESYGRPSAPISVDKAPPAAGSNFRRRPGAAFAAAAAASRQMGPSDSAASKFAKTFVTRQKYILRQTSEYNRSEVQRMSGYPKSADQVPNGVTRGDDIANDPLESEFSHDDSDGNRFTLYCGIDTQEEDNVKEIGNDETYTAVIEECLDKVENLTSTIADLQQQGSSSSNSCLSEIATGQNDADEDDDPLLSSGVVDDSSSSNDVLETDDEDIDDGSRARDPVELEHQTHERSVLVDTVEPESTDVASLNTWIEGMQEHVIASTLNTHSQAIKISTLRTSTESDEEQASSDELLQHSDCADVESQKEIRITEEEPQRTTLQIAEEREKKAASSGLHWEEGAVAQPMRLEGIQRGAPAIGLLQLDSGGSLSFALKSADLRRDHGTPQALAVHSNFIAIGMSKGPVLIIPSKYSATKSADETDAKPYILIPPASEKHQMAVSSMSFNQQGDLLLVGYSKGHIILWDVPKASVGRHIENNNGVPIVHAVFVGQDVTASRTIRAITADSRGQTLLLTFTQIPVLRRFSLNTAVLLDGQRTGVVLSLAPLLPNEGTHIPGSANASPSGISSSPINLGTVMSVVGGGASNDVGRKFLYDGSSSNEEGGGLVVLATYQAALVVRLLPTIVVCARFVRPEGIRDVAIPYTAWRRTKAASSGTSSSLSTASASSAELSQSTPSKNIDGRPSENGHLRDDGPVEAGTAKSNGDGGESFPLLAMAWDTKVLVLQLVKGELKIVAQWDLDSPAIGVAWLEEQMVVVATAKDELCLFTNEGVEIERAALCSEHGGLGAVTYHTHFSNMYGNPEKAYHNSLAVRGAALYLLGPVQLWRARLLPWRDRISALQNAGDSLGAFHIAMEIYDGRSQGVTGLPRGLDAMREAIMPTLLSLLSSYIDEAFAYLSLAFGSSPSSSSGSESAIVSQIHLGKPDVVSSAVASGTRDSVEELAVEAREQYARVGGVAIEFCVHIHKTEVLFENVFSKFDAVGQRGTFLELLEPYILKDMLSGLAPEVMQALVEHYSSRGWLNRVEQCVLHMDIASLDFNQVVRVCRDHGLYSALIYLFTKGLDDYKSPLEELLAVSQQSVDPQQARGFGLKLLVYLKYCFSGLAFPPGNGTLSPSRLPHLRTELLEYLLDVMESKKEVIMTPHGLGQKYSRLLYLLTLDTQATLQVLGAAFPEDGPLGVGKRDCVYPLIRTNSEEDGLNKLVELQIKSHSSPNQEGISEGLKLAQITVNALIHVLQTVESARSKSRTEEKSSDAEYSTEECWPSDRDIGDIFEFVAYFAAGKYAVVPTAVLSLIFEYLTSPSLENLERVQDLERKKLDILRQREDLMLAVLKAVPKSSWQAERTLDLALNIGFWKVKALLHAERGDFAAALESYLKAVDRPQDPFTFISEKLSSDDGLKGHHLINFRESVLSHIPELIQLSPVSTLLIVLKHLSNENQLILKELSPHPRLLFNYMKAIMNIRSGGFSYPENEAESQAYLADLLERSGLEFTDEMAENFVELLCRFEPKSVLAFLESYENYRLEHCLRLCQDYGITDAAAFLLERVGDVASALSLVIADVDRLLQEMDLAIAKYFFLPSASKGPQISMDDMVKDRPEVTAVHSVVRVAVALCQRNTFRLEPKESESLWFRLLDRFVEPLREINLQLRKLKTRGQFNLRTNSKSDSAYDATSNTDVFCWKVVGIDVAVQAVRTLLVQYIGEIVNGMMGFVPISVTMSKILEDHGGHEFGDFKATILDMLSAYGYERAILGTANKLIEDDTFENIHALRRGCSHAFIPSANICSVCGLRLDEPLDLSHLKSAAGTVASTSSISTKSNDRQKGKVDDKSGSMPLEENRLRVRIFPCGHASHYMCVDFESGMKKRTFSGFVVCPICSYRGKPVDFSHKAKDSTLLRDSVIEVGGRKRGDHVSTNLSQLGRMHKTTNRIFGKSRLEILKQLERGTDLHELGPSLELSLAPPVLTSYKRPNSHPSSNTGSVSGRVNSRSSLTSAVMSVQRKSKVRARY
ncbi:vacuolar protein sorting-associated protein 8 [Marchantia polymorpha subsp. ruderalis]|uniref:RING-type domain-containing protein n=1 Tax=Marchantia polymorpha TaxID=3197 RepID=A0A2R6WRT9_MARPO|nr:hypothetical protein MARPO_0063s0095 [Marchantia polymorpha]BBN19147.1 hypothetical protein Mp_8g08230 [Marchantia polymorpha subsp. ruderalis]PTQ36565.1 hypothetical protein MARPO_0063s0095 [Marchantia polymorpha]PTQ36566.1 hypothetical protein MARPO_0063s0095 [Marchantia polymorpha]BBN19148.1 hypothetical protein Mp_8g08230 [Marchantia polymorpha subsp. ruderalis]|eukprot:PTQ36564.1 hypothetical protein MARPO_0063s0095 [Marchantia polymorpha]